MQPSGTPAHPDCALNGACLAAWFSSSSLPPRHNSSFGPPLCLLPAPTPFPSLSTLLLRTIHTARRRRRRPISPPSTTPFFRYLSFFLFSRCLQRRTSFRLNIPTNPSHRLPPSFPLLLTDCSRLIPLTTTQFWLARVTQGVLLVWVSSATAGGCTAAARTGP